MHDGAQPATEPAWGREPRPLGWWVGRGAAGGAIAGVVFLALQMALSAARRGSGGWLLPLERIGKIAIPGRPAIEASLDLTVAVGLAVHAALSVAFGLLFAAAVARALARLGMGDLVVAAAPVYGLLLWIGNYYLIAPRFGWDWFPFETNLFVQAAAHVFGFGAVLGLVLDRAIRAPPRPPGTRAVDLAVVAWVAASLGFSVYVSNFGDYGATYGSLGGVVVLLLYFFVSAAALLLGAEVNAAIYHATEGGGGGQTATGKRAEAHAER